MKKMLLVLILVSAMAMPAFAQVTITGPNQSGNQVGLANEKEIGANIQQGQGQSQTFNPVNTNTNTLTNSQAQSQGQSQGQGQHQSSVNVNKNTSISDASAKSASFNAGNNQTVNEATQFVGPQPIYPYLLQIIPGVVGDMTKDIPTFSVKPLGIEEVVKIDSYTRGGRIAGFSRLEDYDSDLLDLIPSVMKNWGQKDTSKMRVKVYFKMSSKTIGSGGGAGGSVGGFGTTAGASPLAWASNASILPGVAVNTADPKIIIKFYLIK